MCRVNFDRNQILRAVETCLSKQVIVRADDERVAVFLEHKQRGAPPALRGMSARTSSTLRTSKVCSSRSRVHAAGSHCPRRSLALDVRSAPDTTRLLAAGSRSIHREIVRLTLLVELFGEVAVTQSAVAEVMSDRACRRRVRRVRASTQARSDVPQPAPLRLGNDALDAISLREPDLVIYDHQGSPP
jgi:hypothetical protein